MLKEAIRVCCAPGSTPCLVRGGKNTAVACSNQEQGLWNQAHVLILGLNSTLLQMVVSGHMPGQRHSKMTRWAAGLGLHPLNKAFMFCVAVYVMLLSCLDFP